MSVAVPVTAEGRTISDLRAEAARIETQIQANGDRIAALSGADFSAPIVSVPAIGGEGERSEAEIKPGQRPGPRPPGKAAAPATPKRKPGKDRKRRRDAERFGEPELARRDKRRGRGPAPGQRRGR